MADKTYIPDGETVPSSQIGATLEALAATIAERRDAGEGSYTHKLLVEGEDTLLKKVVEEAGEVALAAKEASMTPVASSDTTALDAAIDHLRYEAADVVYHLLVVLERYGITLDEFAAELNTRMTETERPVGGMRLFDEYVKRGK